MQLSQFYFWVRLGGLWAAVALFLAIGSPVLAADDGQITPTRPRAPDPILNGPARGPCDPERDWPNYVGGTDINGHPVVSANVPGPKATLDSDTVYPEVGTGSQATGRTGLAVTVTGLRKAMDPAADCSGRKTR